MYGIPKTLPNDHVAQGRLISYMLIALLIGDVSMLMSNDDIAIDATFL